MDPDNAVKLKLVRVARYVLSRIFQKVKFFGKTIDNQDHCGTIKLGTLQTDGGPGSGNFGHKGVPGQVGGSAPASGANVSGNSSNAGTTANPTSGVTVSSSKGNAQFSSPRDVRKELDARIASGAISTKLNAKKQSDHIAGSDRYNKRLAKGDHPSILDMPEN